MTSAQSTRNTSMRTRKIRGDDSLVSSISIAARGEGFWGIAGASSMAKGAVGPSIWHRNGGKKGRNACFSLRPKGNQKLKPGIIRQRISAMFDVWLERYR